MHVHINPKQFLERLRAVSALAGKRFPFPILETVQLDAAADGRGLLRASDLDSDVEVSVPLLKVIRPGVVQLPRAQLVKTLGEAKTSVVTLEELPAETVPITPDPKLPSRRLEVRTPRLSLVLMTFDPEHFPAQTRAEPLSEVTVVAWRLTRLIERTEFAADEASTRFALSGSSFEFADGKLHLVSTDGRSLAHAFEEAKGTGLLAPGSINVGEEERPLVPAVSRRALVALAGILALMENAPLTLGFTPEGRLQVKAPSLCFTSRLLEGRFPPWREVFPEPSKTALKVLDPARLQKALKEAFQLTVQGNRATELRLSGARLGIVVRNDTASFRTDIVVQNLSEGPEKEGSVFIDPSYLLPYLARQKEPFVLRFPPEKGRPLVFESPGFRYALMPMDRPDAPAPAAEASPAKDRPPADAELPEPPAEEAQSLSA